MERQSQFPLMFDLAARDYRHEWIMSGCFVLALAAVLVPLLVLFGLKHGIISNLLDPLKEDPRYREIRPSGSGSFGPDWFESLGERAEVEFLVPRTRAIAATIKLRDPAGEVGRIIDAELVPSAAGDPVLPPAMPPVEGFDQVVLSADAADKLGAGAGSRLEGLISRVYQGRQETERLPLAVAAVAPAAAFSRDGLFVSLPLLMAIEDFRDGRAVPALGWQGGEPRTAARSFAGFRMYAAGIDDVAALRADLLAAGVDVRTRVADIELVRTLDRNLSIVFWIIAIIAASSYCLSFGSSVWANVDRKRREFSVLRLTGFRSRAIVWYPILQALLTGVLGWVIACLVFYLVQAGLNVMFEANLGAGRSVCRLQVWHLLATLGLTLLAAALAAALGGVRIAQLEPSLGLRES